MQYNIGYFLTPYTHVYAYMACLLRAGV